MGIAKKLIESKVALHSQKLEKTGNNNGRPFFQLADFLPQTLALFAQKGLCGIVSFPAGRAVLTVIDVDDESQRVEIESPFGSAALKGCHEVQNIGAVETYQRRYLWMTVMDIIESDGLEESPATDGQVTDYLSAISAATTMDELQAAIAAAEAATKGNRDPAVKSAIAKLKSEQGKKIQAGMPLSEERFDSGVAAFRAGKCSMSDLTKRPLTARQEGIIADLKAEAE